MTRAYALLACLALSSCAGGGNTSEDDVPAQGAEREACYPNGTCNEGLVCASSRCVKVDGAAGSTASGGKGGAGAAPIAGHGGAGAASTGGQPAAGGMFVGGAAGASSSGAGGVAAGGGSGGAAGDSSTGGAVGAGAGGDVGAGGGGAAGAASCAPPKHLCAEVCVGNTPETGCSMSATCEACVAPANADATCTAGGVCGFNCSPGYALMGGVCVATGAGGAAGSGGSTGGGVKCSNCVGTCAFALEDYNCLLDCLIDGMDCRWDKSKTPACECF